MAQIGVLAQLAQQAHENVTREQNFRSALFQQAEQNMQSHRQLRISEMNAINGSISNIIRSQENSLLRQQEQERLAMQTQSLIDHRKAQEADAAQRTQLAIDAQRAKEEERQAEAQERALRASRIQEGLRNLGVNLGPPQARSDIPPVTLETEPQTITSPPAEGGLGQSIAAMAQAEPEPEPTVVEGMGPKGPTRSVLPTGNKSIPDSSLFPLTNRDGEVVSAGPRGATISEVLAANDLRIADATVNKEEVGQRGNEVILKSPGVDPEQTAKAAIDQANKAGSTPNAVPGPEFVSYPDTVEQQQINQGYIEQKQRKLAALRALDLQDTNKDYAHILKPMIESATLEVEQLEKRNTLTGEVKLTGEERDLIVDYIAAEKSDPDFVEFVNTQNGEKMRRDQFVAQMVARGKGVIKQLRDIGANDLAKAVEESLSKEGKGPEVLGNVPRDATLGKRGTKGPVAPSGLNSVIEDMLKRNQKK